MKDRDHIDRLFNMVKTSKYFAALKKLARKFVICILSSYVLALLVYAFCDKRVFVDIVNSIVPSLLTCAGVILSAVIGVLGVYLTIRENKNRTYKEIVTNDRKLWLKTIKANLSEFMSICDVALVHSWGKDYYEKKERATDLYYKIIADLNIKDKNDRKKILALYNYAINKNLDVVLNFNLHKDDNKDKIEGKKETEEIVDLKLGTREEVMKQFMDLFKNEWEVVKREAD